MKKRKSMLAALVFVLASMIYVGWQLQRNQSVVSEKSESMLRAENARRMMVSTNEELKKEMASWRAEQAKFTSEKEVSGPPSTQGPSRMPVGFRRIRDVAALFAKNGDFKNSYLEAKAAEMESLYRPLILSLACSDAQARAFDAAVAAHYARATEIYIAAATAKKLITDPVIAHDLEIENTRFDAEVEKSLGPGTAGLVRRYDEYEDYSEEVRKTNLLAAEISQGLTLGEITKLRELLAQNTTRPRLRDGKQVLPSDEDYEQVYVSAAHILGVERAEALKLVLRSEQAIHKLSSRPK